MPKSKYTAELLAPLVASSESFAQVLAKLGLQATGGNYRHLAFRLRFLNISTEHFKGQGWSRGQTRATHAGVAHNTSCRERTDEEVFVENSPESCGARLSRRLKRLGRAYVCGECGISEWNGRPLNLHVDHVNGVNNDNRFENLRFLCPNCHSQTASYCRKGYAKKAR